MLDLAAERAARAGDFAPSGCEFVFQWPGQERTYPAYNAAALDATRRYGLPPRVEVRVWGYDPLQVGVTFIADDYGLPGDGDRPTVRVSAAGIAGDRVKAAFDAACATLSDPALENASRGDVLEIRAVEQLDRAEQVVSAHPLRHRMKETIRRVEAHPALVSVIGILIAAAVAVLVG